MRTERKYRKLLILVVFLTFSQLSFAQSDDQLDYRPSIGLGTGVLKFYGDVQDSRNKSILSGRPAFELNLYSRLNNFLNIGFYVLRGKIAQNEIGNGRNLNFQSQITTGGIVLEYDFNNFLKEKRFLSPYISVGVESFEFQSKADLGDRAGNTYYYWNDGSIRNIDDICKIAPKLTGKAQLLSWYLPKPSRSASRKSVS